MRKLVNVAIGSKAEIGPRNPDFRSSFNSRHSPTRPPGMPTTPPAMAPSMTFASDEIHMIGGFEVTFAQTGRLFRRADSGCHFRCYERSVYCYARYFLASDSPDSFPRPLMRRRYETAGLVGYVAVTQRIFKVSPCSVSNHCSTKRSHLSAEPIVPIAPLAISEDLSLERPGHRGVAPDRLPISRPPLPLQRLGFSENLL